MKAMDAWKRISSNMQQLYRIRSIINGDKGYDDSDIEAEVIAFGAL